MARQKLLCLIVPVGLFLALLPAAVASATVCSADEKRAGACPGITAKTADGFTTLGGTDASPGSGGSAGHPRAARQHAIDPNAPVAICALLNPHPPCVPRDGSATGTDGITLHDLKSFAPAPGVDHAQPNGWAIIGLASNFYATTPSEVQKGTLLGKPVQVRFVPVAWHWNYGDGVERATATPGAPWVAEGLGEFDPTPTSHVFAKRGSYAVDLDIRFVAEYSYGHGGWIRVAGTIDVAANRLRIRAGTVRTVLVARDCLADPRGPGC